MRIGGRWAAVAAATCLAIPAYAHEVQCVKTVNGEVVHEVKAFPATLEYEIRIINTDSVPSTVSKVSDPMLENLGWSWGTPFTMPVGASESQKFSVVVRDEAECLALADLQQCGASVFDNVAKIGHDAGEAQCRARVICRGGGGEDECPPDRAKKLGLGFWKNHALMVQQCVAGGAVDLGTITARTMADFMGIFWGDPSKYDDGSHRSKLDHLRFLLQRELLVATCNVRVLGAELRDSAEPALTVSIIEGTDCVEIQGHGIQLDLPKKCEDRRKIEPGPATPQANQALADDPTAKSTQQCTRG